MEQLVEKPFFFENEGSRLFGILHTPFAKDYSLGAKELRGVVFCHPFAEEKNVSHRVVTKFARFLCRQGYHVLRFDYRSCGDSEGEFEEATLATRLSDIGRAIDILLEHMGTSRLTLFGLRLGGTLAALAAAEDPRVESLILWEPIVEVRGYFDHFLRMQVMAENIREGTLVGRRQTLLKDLQGGKCVDILGYLLSPRCFEGFVNVNVPLQVMRFRGPTLIVAISKQKRQRKDLEALLSQHSNARVQMLHVQDRPFWIDLYNPWREFASWQGHGILFEQTADWLNAIYRD